MIKNRLKKRETTFCTYTKCGTEIKEGDILGYGDNYSCVILYNKWEAKFEAIEFGYIDDGYIYRSHNIHSYTVKWKILGNMDNNSSLLIKVPKEFDYNKSLEQFYIKQ